MTLRSIALISILTVGAMFAVGQNFPGRRLPGIPRPVSSHPVKRFGNPNPNQVRVLPPLLRKVVFESNRLKYSGKRSVQVLVNGTLKSHDEIVTRDGGLVRVDFPPDSQFAGQIIIDNGHERQRYIPKRNVIQIQPSFRDEAISGLVNKQGKELHPLVDFSPGAIIAGQKTEVASLSRKRGFVFQRLWIEPRSGAILQRIAYNPNGQVVAWFAYQTIDFNPRINPGMFKLNFSNVKRITPLDTLTRIAKELRLPAGYLEENSGFKLVSCRKRNSGGSQFLWSIYQGGNGVRLSVFELKDQINLNKIQTKAPKGINSAQMNVGGVNFVFVGRISKPELNDFGKFIHFR